MRSQRLVVVASALLVAVLVGTSVAVHRAVVGMRTANADVHVASEAVDRFDELERAVAAQAFAEAAYRRAPGPDAESTLIAALSGVDVALAPILQAPSASDRAAARYAEVLNRRYAAEIRAGLLADGAPVPADDRVAGPALAALGALIDGAIRGHQADAQHARAEETRVLDRVATVVPAARLVALGAIALSWGLLLRQQRRLRRHAAEQEWASTHDPLTGLANRVLMRQTLDAWLADEPSDVSLLLVDLDRFKAVNDTWGHAAGDAVLVAAAERLAAAAEPHGLAVRLGGDEFALLVRGSTTTWPQEELLHATLAAPVDLPDGGTITVAATIGAARARPGDDAMDLLRRADLAMYARKPGGPRVPRARRSGDGAQRPAAVADVAEQVQAGLGAQPAQLDVHPA